MQIDRVTPMGDRERINTFTENWCALALCVALEYASELARGRMELSRRYGV